MDGRGGAWQGVVGRGGQELRKRAIRAGSCIANGQVPSQTLIGRPREEGETSEHRAVCPLLEIQLQMLQMRN